jgi:hypothetical protein
MNVQSLVSSKRLRLMALTALLAGCGGPVRDTDPRIGALIHQCFATVNESIFVSAKCQPVGTWAYCDTVSSLNPHADPRWTFPHFPPTLQAYRDDPVYWSGRIHEEEKQRQRGQFQPDRVVIYGGLPIGTQLEIGQISRWFNGENGTFWVAYANIQDGEFKGRRIFLPWEGGLDSHGWIHAEYDPQSRGETEPGADSRFLTKCAPKK